MGLKICVAIIATLVGIAEFSETRTRNKVWQDDLTLWTDTLSKSPHNGRVMMNLGVGLMARGNYPLAEYYFERAKLYLDQYSLLEVNFGVLNAARGDMKEAEFHFLKALELDANERNNYIYYANWLKKWGRPLDADTLLDKGRQKGLSVD